MDVRRIVSHSILSGIAISVGGAVYVSIGGIAGAIFFTFGLITILHFRWPLYTGSAGFVKTIPDLTEMLLIIVFNAVGCWLAAEAVGFGRPELIEKAQTIVDARLMRTWWECFVLAIGCGFVVNVAVVFGRQARWLPMLFGVPAFIFVGFLHSIADVFYISLVGDYSAEMIARWGAVVAGNFIGCNVVRIFNWQLDYSV